MSIIIAPDSFKGSMTAEEFCAVLEPLCKERAPEEAVICLPLADGGEGTLDCILAATGGEPICFDTVDALGAPISAPVGFLPDGSAVIEVAQVIGLPMVQGREDPLRASTYGLGILIRRAIEKGAKRITLTLGGSATNDLGLGMLSALGWEFMDQKGDAVDPCGGAMEAIAKILPPIDPIYQNVEFIAMCDVKTPCWARQGAPPFMRPKRAQALPMLRGWRRAQKILPPFGAKIPMRKGPVPQAGWAMPAFIFWAGFCARGSKKFCGYTALRNY